MTPPTRGVSARLVSLAAAGTFGSYPGLDIVSLMLKWHQHETANGTWAASPESQLASAISYMLAHDKAAMLRPMGGIDSPIGMPFTSQPSWLNGLGVGRIRTLDNETSSYSREVWVPDLVNAASRNTYIAQVEQWAARIATKISAHGGTMLCVCAPGVENGAEMSLGPGPGGPTTYTNCGTLTSTIGTTGTIASFGVTTPSGATGSAIFKIGSELFHGTRSGGTVTVAKRAHSGSIAASHTAGAQVQIATAKITQAVFNGYPSSGTAPYDHQTLLYAQWATLGSLATVRAGLTTYWTDAVLALASALPSEVGIGLAGGQVFADWGPAYDTLDAVGPTLGDRLWAFTTNLSDGRDYPSTHPNEDAWLLAARDNYDAQIVTQTEATARLPEPPTPGALQELVDCGQFAIERYGSALRVFETGQTRFKDTTSGGVSKAQSTSASGAWAAHGPLTPRQYLVTAA